MSDPVFDAALGVLSVINGIVSLRNARRGFLPQQQFITLGKNPVEPERMTPRIRRFTRYGGAFLLIVGTLLIGAAIYRFVRG